MEQVTPGRVARPAPTRFETARRLGALGLIGAGTVVTAAVAAAAGLPGGGAAGARRGVATSVAVGLQRLGPTAAKAGQLIGSRRDMIGPIWADALGVLHDRARPMSAAERAVALRRARDEVPALADVEVTGILLGSGTVGCVYRGAVGSERVAVKLRRPGVDRLMAADLRLLRAAASLAVRWDRTGGRPLADLVDYVADVIMAQTDYIAEAENHRVLAANLARLPGVDVPALYPDLCGSSVLVTRYVPGLGARVPPTAQAVAARRALRAVRRMVFEDGFVHCDLHPGNLYVHGNGRVVLLDAGYAVRVSEHTRESLDRFFRAIAIGDGRTCGEIVFDSAPDADERRRGEFVEAMERHVRAHGGDGGVFTMAEFGNGIFELQTRYGVHSRAEFVFPLSALMVAEGTLRSLMPTVEIQDGF
ncbi:AarF/ABC1/UbiB kinase family protein [Nocardiopsis sp. N85]|uniref:ABC1 kinase family protein n=1 Tax=Nocardiopsis sp. N85 TaxID=3029400 RepID=UPI00237F6E8C|nr:AarF/ABC1/UbiB kinase family protein [Nocardiopsis sp. N85]MDE3723223.1 AarF/ABC1/UbiB kinase family protein [Nocardiopsis sp. N85]